MPTDRPVDLPIYRLKPSPRICVGPCTYLRAFVVEDKAIGALYARRLEIIRVANSLNNILSFLIYPYSSLSMLDATVCLVF